MTFLFFLLALVGWIYLYDRMRRTEDRLDRETQARTHDKDLIAELTRRVLPDRVLFYLWPLAGGASFDFTLRGRMPAVAKSSASTLCDYYNPEARSELAPIQWLIK
jgi:hypothetical protein